MSCTLRVVDLCRAWLPSPDKWDFPVPVWYPKLQSKKIGLDSGVLLLLFAATSGTGITIPNHISKTGIFGSDSRQIPIFRFFDISEIKIKLVIVIKHIVICNGNLVVW